MSTIPASEIANIVPGVLGAGGNALETVGVMLVRNRRVPIGTVASFASSTAVEDFFGAGSTEATLAPYYFGGFVGSAALPGAMLAAQFPAAGAAAWLQGGDVAGLTLPQLQGVSGSLSVVMDGYAFSAASINLSSATSFSAAAGIIETGLNASLPAGASVTGAIAAETTSVTGSIAGNVLTVTAVDSGTLVPGAMLSGPSVTAGTEIVNQLSGTSGGIGTYAVSQYQSVASETVTAAYGELTVTAVASGSLSVGQTLSGAGVSAGTQITGLGTGTGGTGTYYVSPSQSVASEAITATASPLSVAYDSVSGGFLITSGQAGPSAGSSSAAYATGTAASNLALTQATGATISQGALAQTPGAFMTALASVTQDWFSFFTDWDPDDANGAVGQNAQKMAFAAWTSQQPDTPYAYVTEDTDISPSQSVPAASSMRQLLKAQNLSGTCAIWTPTAAAGVNSNPWGSRAAFVSGCGGAVDFEEEQGRITYAFKSSPAGLLADVTTAQVAQNLAGSPQNVGNGQPVGGNGYNYYGAYATAAENFVFFYPGSVSGPFQWLDAYLNQAWMNSQFQLDVLQLMTSIKSFPYNAAGNALLESALLPTIKQALEFGAIQPGITLSAAQIAQVNNAAGKTIAPTLSSRGWYLLIGTASAAVRAARGSPPATFWYTDGDSIQVFSLNSIDVQ